MPMTAEELEQVKERVLRDLPRALESDPRFVVFVEGIISEKFPRRDEFARLLDEFQAMRSEMAQRFEAMQREMTTRFEAVDQRLANSDQRLGRVEQRLDGMDQRLGGVEQRLDGVDQRLGGVEQRLDGVDQRLGRVEQRLDGVDQRLGAMDQRFEAVDRRFDTVDQRFDAVDQRFEAVDQRFDAVDQRFEAVDQRFDAVDQRFEAVDRRFDAVDQRFEVMDRRFEELTNEVRGLRHWMHLNVGGLQGRIGRRMEDVVAGAFCYGLERADIKPENVKLRQKIVDPEGVVFRPGRQREVDIIALDREIIVFEVKAAADPDDVESFADKVELVRHQNPNIKVDGVLVSLGADARVRRRCAEKGLRLIP
jgi:hypothetical protein